MTYFLLALFCLFYMTCFGHARCVYNDRGCCCQKGDKGDRGFTGEDGKCGKIDEDKIQEIVRREVEKETQEIREKVEGVLSHISETRVEIEELKTEIKTEIRNNFVLLKSLIILCGEGVIHEGKCYWAEVHQLLDTNFEEAQNICSNKKARLADIHGENHFNKLMGYLRAKLDDRDAIYVWTGMKKIHEDNVAQLSGGSDASFTSHRSEEYAWIDAGERRTHVYLFVRSSTSDADQGMGAYLPNLDTFGALCQCPP